MLIYCSPLQTRDLRLNTFAMFVSTLLLRFVNTRFYQNMYTVEDINILLMDVKIVYKYMLNTFGKTQVFLKW